MKLLMNTFDQLEETPEILVCFVATAFVNLWCVEARQMEEKNSIVETSYTPVQYVFREMITEELEKRTVGRIFYFGTEELISCLDGTITVLKEINGQGLFIELDSGKEIRIDRIITLFGKPGPAYDEYDAYSNVCLSCTGGYEI